MEPTNQLITNNSSVASTTGSLASDYLVTQKIDPLSIPQSQIDKDLEMFKKAEDKVYSKTPDYMRVTKDIRSKSLPGKPLTKVDILRIKNPFRGE